MASNLVKFLAVGRLVKDSDGNFQESQHQVISDLAHDEPEAAAVKSYRNHVKQIMNKGAPKLLPNKRIRLTSENNEYDLHVMADALEGRDDSIIVFFAITDVEIGKAYSIPKLLDEFKSSFYAAADPGAIRVAKGKGNLHKLTQPTLKSLMKKYGSSKIEEVKQQVEAVKDQMRDNVAKTLENVETLEGLETRSEIIDNKAKDFHKNSAQMKSKMRCRYIKMTAMIVGLLAVIILIIALAISRR